MESMSEFCHLQNENENNPEDNIVKSEESNITLKYFNPPVGGISLNLNTHLNQILWL